MSSPTDSQLVTGTTSVPSVIPASDSLGVHTPEIPTENTPTGSTRLLRPSTLQQLGIDSVTTGMGEGPLASRPAQPVKDEYPPITTTYMYSN